MHIYSRITNQFYFLKLNFSHNNKSVYRNRELFKWHTGTILVKKLQSPRLSWHSNICKHPFLTIWTIWRTKSYYQTVLYISNALYLSQEERHLSSPKWRMNWVLLNNIFINIKVCLWEVSYYIPVATAFKMYGEEVTDVRFF